jgi:integrase
MTQEITIIETMTIGQIANKYAEQNKFSNYQERKTSNTLRRQHADLALFAEYLNNAGMNITSAELFNDPAAWSGITHGLVEGFVRWQLQKGYSIGSVNVRLSTIKTYCKLATSAGVLSPADHGLIALVKGFSDKDGRNIDEKREVTRVGDKKEEPIILSAEQAKQLKKQPDTAQGARDAFLMCLLLDHGLRCSEVAGLKVTDIDLNNGILTFYRKKVDKVQKHELTRATLIAATRYFAVASPDESLIMGSRKGGALTGRMSERAITGRVEVLCNAIGIENASAHDGRHCWATLAIAGGTDIKALQDAGGWKSPSMPLRYAASATIANKGVKLA